MQFNHKKKVFFALILATLTFRSAYSDMIIGVTSKGKPIKTDPVKRVFKRVFGKDVHLAEYKALSRVPEQPVSRVVGELGAKNRLADAQNQARSAGKFGDIFCWVSTENFLEDPNDLLAQSFTDDPANPKSLYWDDRAAIVVECPLGQVMPTVFSDAAPLPIKYVIMAQAGGVETGGFSVTSGDMVHSEISELESGNWHIGAALENGLPILFKGRGKSRDIFIEEALYPVILQIRNSAIFGNIGKL